jgi:hypothetical protein
MAKKFKTKSGLMTLLLAASLLAGGCGRYGPATYAVTGTVTWNGAPLPDGSIVFMAADDKAAPAAGVIQGGTFAFAAQAGKKKVEIRAIREVGEVIPVMGVKARQSYIPAQYNSQTILTAEVLPGGPNQFAFDLKDTPKEESRGKKPPP